MRYRCVCSYDGSDFHGFQAQRNLRTVQSAIEKALFLSLHYKIRITAAGRTDTGAHALGQVFHFDMPLIIEGGNLRNAVNSRLPKDIYITEAARANDTFHARIHAKSKEYLYIIDFGEYNPINNNYRFYCAYPHVDFTALKKAMMIFVGRHDFRYFSRSRKIENTVREIYSVRCEQNDNVLKIMITGQGFLHNMVRIMVASALEVARGKLDVLAIKKALSGLEPLKAPKKLPANGLYLVKIMY